MQKGASFQDSQGPPYFPDDKEAYNIEHQFQTLHYRYIHPKYLYSFCGFLLTFFLGSFNEQRFLIVGIFHILINSTLFHNQSYSLYSHLKGLLFGHQFYSESKWKESISNTPSWSLRETKALLDSLSPFLPLLTRRLLQDFSIITPSDGSQHTSPDRTAGAFRVIPELNVCPGHSHLSHPASYAAYTGSLNPTGCNGTDAAGLQGERNLLPVSQHFLMGPKLSRSLKKKHRRCAICNLGQEFQPRTYQ